MAAVPSAANAGPVALVPLPQSCTTIIEQSLAGQPTGLAVGSDARIWTTFTAPRGVEAVAPSSGAAQVIRIPGLVKPQGGARGPDGKYWLVDGGFGAEAVWQVTPGGAAASFPLPVGSAPQDITAGPDGRLWFTETGSNKIGSINPNGTGLTEYLIPTAGASPWGIASGPGTKVSFAELGKGKIGQLDTAVPSGGITEIALAAGTGPQFLTADTVGNLWVTLEFSSRVARISPSGVITYINIPTADSSPAGIAVAPLAPAGDGGIWFAEKQANKIGRIDPLTLAVTETLIDVASQGAGPGRVIAPGDGMIWFTEETASKLAHFRVDPTGAVLPVPPQVQLTASGPTITLPNGQTAYSSQTVLTVTVTNSGACATSVSYRYSQVSGTGTWVTVAGATATFQLPDGGSSPWYLEYYATGPNGGTSGIISTSAVVDNTLFPDQTAPTITVPAGPVVVTATGALTAVTFTVTATDVDNAPATLTISCDHPSGSGFAPGDTPVTCTASDPTGNTTSGLFTVRVVAPPPTLTVPASFTTVATGPSSPITFRATAFDAFGAALDVRCTYGGSTITSYAVDPTYGTFPVRLAPGLMAFTCTTTDGRGQTVSSSFAITVTIPPPTLTVPTSFTVYATSPAGATVTYTVSASSAVYGPLTSTCTPPSGTTLAPGTTTTVSCTTSDQDGRVTTGTFTVTVAILPPSLTVPAPIAVDSLAGTGATVSYATSASSLVYGTITPVCSTPSGSLFPVGVTTVTCTATDPGGRMTSKTFTVTVTIPPPTLSLPAPMTVTATGPTTAVAFVATATSAGGALLPVNCTPASGSAFGLGATTVTCSATDRTVTTTRSFTVTVNAPAPTITVPADIIVAPATTAVVAYTATASSVVDGSLAVTCVPPSGSTFLLGTTVVACTTVDRRGVSVSRTFNVTVVNVAFVPTQFVIWGGNERGVQVGQHVVFWGEHWWDQVNLPEKSRIKEFKGWAATMDRMIWTTKGGNAKPPETLPTYISVIITTSVERTGADDKGKVRGNVVGHAVLRVDAPYRDEPGRPVSGVVVALIP